MGPREGAVALSYDDEGEGEALLFVHGGACDRSFWDPQVEHFRGRYRLVVPDLRGHGQSPVPDGEYSIAAFASDVAALSEELGLGPATVIGHSLGGLVAFVLPALHPGVAARVVALDSPLLLRAEAAAAFQSFARATPDDEFREAAKRMLDGAMSPDVPATVRAQVRRGQDAIDLSVFISLSSHVFANCYEELIVSCDVPALCLSAVMANDVERLAALCPTVSFGQVVGSGHFLQLEVPSQVNSMLDRFLERTSSRGSPERALQVP
jgi:pimeloyl-ACP methyl ester carboxylesterase